MRIQVTISGDKEEIAKLKKLGVDFHDFHSALRRVGTELKQFYSEKVFKSGGGATGTKWAALSPAYSTWKRDHYGNRGILIASGKMQSSFRAVNDKDTLTIDNTSPYFKYHQLGTGYGGGVAFGIGRGGGAHIGRGRNLPARPMLVVNEEARLIAQTIIKADIKDKLAKVQ